MSCRIDPTKSKIIPAYGPENWAKIAPKCAGTNQSPINIVTANALERDIENPIAISMDDPSGAALIKGMCH